MLKEINQEARKKAKEHFNSLIKPVDSLGRLEDMVCCYAGVLGEADPQKLPYPRKAVVVLENAAGNVPDRRVLLKLAAERGTEVLSYACSVEKEQEAFIRGFTLGKGVSRDFGLTSFVLAEGLTIPLLAGAMLGAADGGALVMLEGPQNYEAADLAARMEEKIKDYLLSAQLLKLHIPARSGCGAVLAFALFDAGLRAYKEMEQFSREGVHGALSGFAQKKDE